MARQDTFSKQMGLTASSQPSSFSSCWPSARTTSLERAFSRFSIYGRISLINALGSSEAYNSVRLQIGASEQQLHLVGVEVENRRNL